MEWDERFDEDMFDENLKIDGITYNVSCYEMEGDDFHISVAEVPKINSHSNVEASVLNGYYSECSEDKNKMFAKTLEIFEAMEKCKNKQDVDKLLVEKGLFKE